MVPFAAPLLIDCHKLEWNTVANTHVDANNRGPSIALSVSDNPKGFSGGELETLVEGTWEMAPKGAVIVKSGTWKRHQIFRSPTSFDGNKPHRSLPSVGATRVSLIFYYNNFANELDGPEIAFLEDLGFQMDASSTPEECFFISHYNGTSEAGLAGAIAAKAAAVGRKVTVIARDAQVDGSDLLAVSPFAEDLSLANRGRVRGYHGAFPCGTFTRIRFTGRRLN